MINVASQAGENQLSMQSQSLRPDLPAEGHAHWSRVPIMSVVKTSTPSLGGGFATHSAFTRPPSQMLLSGPGIARPPPAPQPVMRKKNFIEFNKDVRIIMNQKKIERFHRQLKVDKNTWKVSGLVA